MATRSVRASDGCSDGVATPSFSFPYGWRGGTVDHERVAKKGYECFGQDNKQHTDCIPFSWIGEGSRGCPQSF